MAMMAPKEFLERLNAHTEEEQVQIMTNILKWADETQIARQEAEMYKRTADKLSDQIVQLKVEAQVAARMQPGAANADPALKEENEKLRQEIERLKADNGDASGWALSEERPPQSTIIFILCLRKSATGEQVTGMRRGSRRYGQKDVFNMFSIHYEGAQYNQK